MLETIRQLPERIVSWVKPNISQYLDTKQWLIWVVALLIGLGVSVAAIILRETIGFVQYTWLRDTSENVISAASVLPWYVILIGPMVGGLIVGIFLTLFLPGGRAGGVADVIEARSIDGRPIELKPALGSALVSAISLGSGASTGREGPMVHIGAAISTAFSRLLNMPKNSDRILLACGVGGAVSASFNAPFAGVLFAHEVILGHYSMRAFVPIVISSTAGTIFSRVWFGDIAAFSIPDYQISSLWEFPAFVILGIVCALVAILFQFSLMSSEFIARNINMPLWLRPVIGGFFIGVIAIFLPEVLGVGYDAIDKALTNQLPLLLMFTLIIAKTIATSFTLASRFGGGVFGPALYLGAMTGGTFGLIAAGTFPHFASSEGLYAMLGMGAVAAAVLGAPISTTMIVFELTGGFGISIALLLTVSIANGINNAIHGHSFFQWQLKMRGIQVQDGPHRHLMRTKRVCDFMIALEPNEPPPVLEENARTLSKFQTLESALTTFDNYNEFRLAVVDNEKPPNVIGWANHIHALRYLNTALVETIDEEHRQ